MLEFPKLTQGQALIRLNSEGPQATEQGGKATFSMLAVLAEGPHQEDSARPQVQRAQPQSSGARPWETLEGGGCEIPGTPPPRTVDRCCAALEELRTLCRGCVEPAPLCRSCSTHQGLKGRVLHEVIVQVAVGHHPVYLDAEGQKA